jgi:uncharacterized membrane protein
LSQRDALREYLGSALWVLPTASVLVALALGSVLSRVTVPRHSILRRFVFEGTSDDARTLLVGIAGTMITVIALILGLTVVALQLSSTQFSPRLLRNFLRDRPNQLVLSAFVATFAYSTAGLYTVGVSGGTRTESFPRLAVSGAIVLLFLSLFALVFEVHHVAHSMQIDEIMRHVENKTQAVVRHIGAEPRGGSTPLAPATAVAVPSLRSGYVQVIHPEKLLRAAAAATANVCLACRVGDHVVGGTPLAWAWRNGDGAVDAQGLTDATNESIRIGFERTLEQDAAFGIRQLVDVASKALSPAVNDPYTAVQAIDHIAVIMAAIARKEHGTALYTAGEGTTVTIPGYAFGDYLDLSCDQVRRYGASEPTVGRSLIRFLSSTARVASQPSRRMAIGRQLDLVVADAEREVRQPADLVVLRQEADALRAWLTT